MICKEYIIVNPNCISTCSVVVVHGGNSPSLCIWWTIWLYLHTHAKVRIGCIYSHITVSHLSVPFFFYSVGKVCTPSEIYISICMLVIFR